MHNGFTPKHIRDQILSCSSVAMGGGRGERATLPSTGMATGFVQIWWDFLGWGGGGGSDSSPQTS